MEGGFWMYVTKLLINLLSCTDSSFSMQVLWWSTRLTFNSPPIQRHLTRLLYVSGDVGLARRTLRLYVQIVGKAWETRGAPVHASGGAQLETETEADTAQIDTDRAWIQTCVFGARMICRVISSPSGADGSIAKKVNDDLKEAGRLIELARERLKSRIKLDVNEHGKVDKDINEDKELACSVDLAEGIWLSVSAVKREHSSILCMVLSHFSSLHPLHLHIPSFDSIPPLSTSFYIHSLFPESLVLVTSCID